MIASVVLFVLAATLPLPGVTCSWGVKWYDQCGGKGYEGQTKCYDGSECKEINEFFSQCVPLPPGERLGLYEQCGGLGYNSTLCDGRWDCCADGLECVHVNEDFFQCIPEFSLADVGEPCGPATPDNTRCLPYVHNWRPPYLKCSSETEPDAKCVECGFDGHACCPAGTGYKGRYRPPCAMTPRYGFEIPCNTQDDICEGDIIRD